MCQQGSSKLCCCRSSTYIQKRYRFKAQNFKLSMWFIVLHQHTRGYYVLFKNAKCILNALIISFQESQIVKKKKKKLLCYLD